MPADTRPHAELARFIDARGHEVTATIAPSGVLVILTRTLDTGLRDGHPALDVKRAVELRDALDAFIDRAAEEGG